MILSATLFLLAVICYSTKELQSFGKLKWMDEDKPLAFWGEKSDLRKYKRLHDHITDTQPGDLLYEIAPKKWYYKLTKLKYKERFPLSGSLLVFLTDGPHLMQFFYKLLFCFAFYPFTSWWFPVVLWCSWGVTFTLCDKYLSK